MNFARNINVCVNVKGVVCGSDLSHSRVCLPSPAGGTAGTPGERAELLAAGDQPPHWRPAARSSAPQSLTPHWHTHTHTHRHTHTRTLKTQALKFKSLKIWLTHGCYRKINLLLMTHLIPSSWPKNFPIETKEDTDTPIIPRSLLGAHSNIYMVWTVKLTPAQTALKQVI